LIEYLTDWLKKLIMLVLLATFADMLLPNSKMQQYAKMVIGLFIILTMLAPVFMLFKVDNLTEKISLNSLGLGSMHSTSSYSQLLKDGERLRKEQYEQILATLSKQFGDELSQQIEETYAIKNNVEVVLSLNNENEPQIDKIMVYLLGRVHKKDNKDNHLNQDRAVKPVAPVEIHVETRPSNEVVPAYNQNLEGEIESVKDYILTSYDLDQEQVEIKLGKGVAD
jgi:stage III sporulation protein AF